LNIFLAPLSSVAREKCHQIDAALSEDPVDVLKLKKLALSEGGLINGNFSYSFAIGLHVVVNFAVHTRGKTRRFVCLPPTL
jgi:hypothetical protein